MNGTGHLPEDFAAPAYLCPIDLAKFGYALGSSSYNIVHNSDEESATATATVTTTATTCAGFNPIRRYVKLLKLCQEESKAGAPEFRQQATWLTRTLQWLRKYNEDFRLMVDHWLMMLDVQLKAGKRKYK